MFPSRSFLLLVALVTLLVASGCAHYPADAPAAEPATAPLATQAPPPPPPPPANPCIGPNGRGRGNMNAPIICIDPSKPKEQMFDPDPFVARDFQAPGGTAPVIIHWFSRPGSTLLVDFNPATGGGNCVRAKPQCGGNHCVATAANRQGMGFIHCTYNATVDGTTVDPDAVIVPCCS